MSRAAYLGDAERGLLKDIVKEQLKLPGYTDLVVVKKVNDGDLLKLNGGEINEGQVKKARKELGAKIPKNDKPDGRTAAGRRRGRLQAPQAIGKWPKRKKKAASGGSMEDAGSQGSGEFDDMIAELEEKRDKIQNVIDALKAL